METTMNRLTLEQLWERVYKAAAMIEYEAERKTGGVMLGSELDMQQILAKSRELSAALQELERISVGADRPKIAP